MIEKIKTYPEMTQEVLCSIKKFTTAKDKMSKAEPEDLPEEKGREILKKVIDEHIENLRRKQRSIVESIQMERSE